MLTVSVVNPVGGTVFTGPANIILTAVATSTNPIVDVSFYFGTNFIGSVAPVITAYGPIVAGTVALTTASSAVVGTATTFLADFSPGDYINFTSQPAAIYQVLAVGSNIGLTLSTPFTGTTIGADTARVVTLFGYFNFAWNNVAIGNYTLKAVVTDNTGLTATSSIVATTVIASGGSPPVPLITGSSIGFGYNPFGDHEFGVGDWAEEMLWKNIPEFNRNADVDGPTGSLVAQPLRKFTNAIKPSYQELRDKWGQFTTLWDAGKVPLGSLPQLAYNVGITVDPTKPEGLQRSSVLNASQLWINKGTDKGYQITAAFEGLLVDITPLWGETCAAASQLLGTIGSTPTVFDLSTTPIAENPVAPGTLDIKVTTAQGLAQSITDDTFGNLAGNGTQPNGPLTKLTVVSAVTLNLTGTVVGIFGPISVGDTLTQGVASGIVRSAVGFTIKVQVTAGTFAPSAAPNDLVDTSRVGTTATVGSVSVDSLELGEVVVGQLSGTTAIVRDNSASTNLPANPVRYLLIDTITTNAGFTVGESLIGQTSGDFMIAGATQAMVQGPLRETLTFAIPLTLAGIAGVFTVGDTVIRGSAVGKIVVVAGPVIKVNVLNGLFTTGPITDVTGAVTTIGNGSNGLSLPQSVVNVASTTGFLAAGTITVVTGAGPQVVTYTGITSTSFTGCTGGLGLMTTGNSVITTVVSGTATIAAVGAPVTGAFTVGALVTGAPSGATGVVRSVTPTAIQVDVITTPNFAVPDTLTQAPGTTATIGLASFGTINYLTGSMTGTTWPLTAGSTATSVVDLVTTGPTQFLPVFDMIPADMVPLDYVQTDRYALWPRYCDPVRIISGILSPARCRSYSLRLFFYSPDDTEIEDFIDVANRITTSVESFRPIHVRLDKVTFDGARASSQLWTTGKITADVLAVSTWTVSIAADQSASSQLWTISTMAASATT